MLAFGIRIRIFGKVLAIKIWGLDSLTVRLGYERIQS